MKSINNKLMKTKLKNYKKYKEREQEQVLDLNNQVAKCMANASFYRPNTEQCLGCRTDSNFSVVAMIWT